MEDFFHQSKYKPSSSDTELWRQSGFPEDFIKFHEKRIPGRKKVELVFTAKLESGDWVGANISSLVSLTEPKNYDPLRDGLPTNAEDFVVAYCNPGSIHLSLIGEGVFLFTDEKIKIADTFTGFLEGLENRDNIQPDHPLFPEIGNPEKDYESKEMMFLSNNLGVFPPERWISEYKEHQLKLSLEAKTTLFRNSGGMGEFEIMEYLLENENLEKPREILLGLALNSAALSDEPSFVEKLVVMGAALDIGGGPIWNYTSHVKLLINLGVDPNLKDPEDKGSTILHRIVQYGNDNDRELVEFLLSKGADTSIKNDAGKTPKDVSVEQLKDLL